MDIVKIGKKYHSLVYLIFLPLIFGPNCNSLPPTSPQDSEFFDPSSLTWETAEEFSALSGDWYKNGDYFLTLNDDSVRINNLKPSDWSLSTADSYYRLSYRWVFLYYAVYFKQISADSLRFVEADSAAADQAVANLMPVTGRWSALTSRVIWRPSTLSLSLLGNWHVRDDYLEMNIGEEQVTLDGEIWSLDAVQVTNLAKRLVLSRADSVIAIYYRDEELLTAQIMPWGSDEYILDRNGNVTGEWLTLKKWYDFLELSRLRDGAVWDYRFEFDSKTIEVSNETSPQDSIFKQQSLNGDMGVLVEGEIADTADQGSFLLRVSFDISTDEGLYRHFRYNPTKELLADSSWSTQGENIENIFSVVLENDNLWTETPEGRVFFAPRKVDINSRISLYMFTYPFDPALSHFPDTNGLNASLQLPYEIPSSPDPVSIDGSGIAIQGTNRIYIVGGERDSYAEIRASDGMIKIQYSLGSYDRRYWMRSDSYKNPFIREYKYTCTLSSFYAGGSGG
ncbi:MAG: hypothetical protein FVQ81_07540 [Candidatus Glassbacteria bacterium]|nr:hypothetical protein [Candidatus Glassbacteria bacterium]